MENNKEILKGQMQVLIAQSAKSEDLKAIAEYLQAILDQEQSHIGNVVEDGRIKVSVDRTGGGGGGLTSIETANLKNISDNSEELQKLVGFEIPAYDELALTYVASGNGAGEIETIVYKKDSTTVATLTLGYDASDNLTSVTKS